MTPLEHRSKLITTKAAHQHGQATTEDLYAAADAYIAALKHYKKRGGNLRSIPTRAYLIRAL